MDTYKIFGDLDTNNLTNNLTDSDKIKSIYKSRDQLLKGILSMYKFMFSDEKQIWQKTPTDVLEDVANAKYDLNIEVEPYKDDEQLFREKTSMVSALVDFCYIYYVTHYNKDAPLYKLPSKLKFKLIIHVLHCQDTIIDRAIQDAFMFIMDDPIFNELNNEDIPFYISSTLSTEEQREVFKKNIKLVLRDLICNLLRLDQHSVDLIQSTN